MINWKTAYCQGFYQWEYHRDVEKYKKSFVSRVMNKIAIDNSITFRTIIDRDYEEYLERLVLHSKPKKMEKPVKIEEKFFKPVLVFWGKRFSKESYINKNLWRSVL